MKPVIEAQKLDQRVTFMRLATGQDTDGSVKQEWVASQENVPAEIAESGGREALRAGQMVPQFDLLIKVRYRDSVSRADRVLYRGQLFDIQNIKRLGRLEGLEIIAKAVTP